MANNKEDNNTRSSSNFTENSNPTVTKENGTGGPSAIQESNGTGGPNIKVPPVINEEKTNEIKSTKVEVEKDVLDKILSDLAELQQKSTEYEQTASQDQIRKIDALRAKGHLVKAVKLRQFNEKLVIGWKMTKDNVWVADGRLHEVQEMDVFYDDGTKEATTLLQFTRGVSYKSYEVLKESKTASGEVEYTVDVGGGKELVVLNKFVN